MADKMVRMAKFAALRHVEPPSAFHMRADAQCACGCARRWKTELTDGVNTQNISAAFSACNLFAICIRSFLAVGNYGFDGETGTEW